MKDKAGIVYRLNQKLKFHFSNDEFDKKVAEINRFKNRIGVDQNTFSIRGNDLIFSKYKHNFIVQNFDIFLVLLSQSHLKFNIVNGDLNCKTENLNFAVFTAEELFIIHEIWVEGSYNIDPESNKQYTVVDVGMNVGLASLFFSTKDFVKKIYSYEPFKPTFDLAKLNINQNPSINSKIEIYNFGLSSNNEELEVNYSLDNRGRTGIWGTELILNEIKSEVREKIILKSFNDELSKIIQENPENNLILKIDCEGSEYDIFESLNEDLLKPVKCIMLEWHKKGPDMIIHKLKKNHFSTLSFNSKSKKVGMLYAFK